MSPSITGISPGIAITAVKAAFKHFISNKCPPEWDLLFHVRFEILRYLTSQVNKWALEDLQAATSRPLTQPKGIWAIPVTIKASETSKSLIENQVRATIEKLGSGIGKIKIDIAEISAEWQGSKDVPNSKSSKWAERDRYAELEMGNMDGPVILYFHGGAYTVCSIDTHRPLSSRLARDCGGRVFSVAYRLAPQSQFPAAIIDGILAYRYLIDPPPGALHSPVDPKKLVIAGDSAGGGLAVALMIFLAHAAPAFPLPAGVIGISPWLDLTESFPSAEHDTGLDFVPRGPALPKPSPLWPVPEPRFHFYTDIPLHPLVSPVVAAGSLPECPPVFIVVGDNEYMRDESLYFALNFAKNGGRIRLQNYLAMPHTFHIFQKHPSAITSFREYAKFIQHVGSGKTIETQMQVVSGKGIIATHPLDLEEYSIAFTQEELIKRMEGAIARQCEKRRSAVR